MWCLSYPTLKRSELALTKFCHKCEDVGNVSVVIVLIPVEQMSNSEPIKPITLPPAENPEQEGKWLKQVLLDWMNHEFIPEAVNETIAERAAQVFTRQRMEGEDDVGCLLMAILTEMKGFDFSKSFYSEFAIANAVSDLLLESLGLDRCCGY